MPQFENRLSAILQALQKEGPANSMGPQVYGYPVRPPYPGEEEFFRSNPQVAGMAAEDLAITLNPNSPLSPSELQAVARNEASRLYMRENNVQPHFDVAGHQMWRLADTPYQNDPEAMRQTIAARALSGDPSAAPYTPEQQAWARGLQRRLDDRTSLRKGGQR